MAGRIDRFQRLAERLARVSIECCDAVELIARLATADSVVYVDPPYPGEARNKRHASMTDYRCDMTEPVEHERLAAVLHETTAAVILSGYPTALYERLYADWAFLDVSTTTHTGMTSQPRSKRTERLWSNRPLVDGRFPQLSEHLT